jgi:L-threonylcarbamoyladenylate synthase
MTAISTLDSEAIDVAARLLEAGKLVAFPTETVYGLGADAENPDAVAAIYKVKERPSNHPVIVHIAPEADPGYWAQEVSREARKLIEDFWPGPLTLILPKAAHVPDAATGGQLSIGLRCPSHPVAQALLRAFKSGHGGVAAPSANRFGRVSPTTAQHVWDEFRQTPLVSCVLDGGQSAVGIESTILDLSRGKPVLLRPGHVEASAIAESIGVWPELQDAGAPRVPGNLASHYAPQTALTILPRGRLAATIDRLLDAGSKVALMHHTELDQLIDPARIAYLAGRAPMSFDSERYAHDLYAGLRRLDLVGADLIVVEELPRADQWRAIADRLGRAAHSSLDLHAEPAWLPVI